MRLLSRHFQDVEFFCGCGECDNYSHSIDMGLVRILQRIRNEVRSPIKVTSGIRCEKHNDTIKDAAKNSWHVPRKDGGGDDTAYAADITYSDESMRTQAGILRLYVLADQEGAKGLGLYSGRIHVDTRTRGTARWTDKSWEWKNLKTF